jgi:two-component system sensor histidine kinase LytS
MENLTLLLIERMGILLTIAFLLTRIPLFRQLLDREMHIWTSVSFSVLFGLFGIAGTYAGVVVHEQTYLTAFWKNSLAAHDAIANSSLVGVVIGGLLGGPLVGIGAGLITGVHLYSLGGFVAFPAGLSAPVTGLLAGFVARFFSTERVISPSKALFFGMFAPMIQMALILIVAEPPHAARTLVHTIGLPMVLTNSISIAIFTTMIRMVLKEEERSAANEAERVFNIAERVLPHLKQGLTQETAQAAAKLLYRELSASAVAVTNREQVLAHIGLGADHHLAGERLVSQLDASAIAHGDIRMGMSREQLACSRKDCPLQAAISVPIREGGSVVGLMKLYFKRPQQIRRVEEVLAKGLSNLISNQLTLALAEKMSSLMKDAELRMLQAQIHPHFLFNTLNSIVTLIRTNPDLARHMTIQLGVFMRHNLKMTSHQLVSIEQEMNHLNAYLDIVKIRFAEQFSIQCEIEPGTEDVLIPPGTLQPLVENSIQHGLREKPHGGRITISVKRVMDQVEFVVEDNGLGLSEDLLEQLGQAPVYSRDGNGIGVYNVNQRLISLFGTEARLRFANREEGGCRIRFTIPTVARRMEPHAHSCHDCRG